MKRARGLRPASLVLLLTLVAAARLYGQALQVSTTSLSFAYPTGALEQIVNVSGPSYTFTPTSDGYWLGVYPATGGIYVFAAIYYLASMPTGVYHGTVTLQASSGGSPVTISVTLTHTGYMSVSPGALTFNTSASSQQTLAVSGPETGISFTARGQTFNGGPNWLVVAPTEAQRYAGTPVTITVNVYGQYLPPGTYTGEIDVTLTGFLGSSVPNGIPQRVPVTMTVPGGGNITVTNASGATVSSLSFTAQVGSTVSAAQQIVVSGASGAVNFTYNSSAQWLQVNNSQSGQRSTPATLPITVNPGGLAAGAYQASINLVPVAGQSVSIPVTLTVSPPPAVSATPGTLTFNYVTGGVPPPAQVIQVSGNGGNGSFTATATSSGNWLLVSPASGAISGNITAPLSVSLTNLTSLTPNQTYTGSIVVSGAGGASGSTTVTVTLITSTPLPTIVKVTNAASFNSSDIAAGEIITLFGTALGPEPGVAVTPDLTVNNQLPTTLGGVQVLFNGVAAPMLYAGASQVSAIVPYEIASPVFIASPSLQIKYLGRSSNGFPLTQAMSAPAIFTANSTGVGPGAILNADLSINSKDNPASKNDPVVLYVTGEGQTIPAGASGKITAVVPPFPQPILPPVVTINGQSAPVIFYAEAPGIVAGVLQVNVQIPAGVPSGDLPVVVAIGGRNSQLSPSGIGAVTVSVR
jgi:uncharacterized protein (TIGR03437 family)